MCGFQEQWYGGLRNDLKVSRFDEIGISSPLMKGHACFYELDQCRTSRCMFDNGMAGDVIDRWLSHESFNLKSALLELQL
jgi:hypothetical protein